MADGFGAQASGFGRRARAGGAARSRERLGLLFPALLVWTFFEMGRPTFTPPRLALLISILVLAGWLMSAEKRVSSQTWLLALFLIAMAAGIPSAPNTYSAVWTTYGMVSVLCMCVPLPALVTSVRRVKIWTYGFLAIAAYIGLWAVFHGGYGPGGADAAQDENYVGAIMGMAAPLAYFSMFVEKRMLPRLAFGLVIVVLVAAMVAAEDVSRGAFLGLCTGALYCAARSPRKLLGFGILGGAALTLAALAGPAYWSTIRSTGDVEEGTAGLRLEVWKMGVRAWQNRPVLGAGAGNFRWVVGEGQSEEQFESIGHSVAGSIVAHSLFVELLVDLGTVGVVVFLTVLWFAWKDLRLVQLLGAVGSSRAPPDPDLATLRVFAEGVTASILVTLVNAVFLSLLYFANLWLLVALGNAIRQVAVRAAANQGRGP